MKTKLILAIMLACILVGCGSSDNDDASNTTNAQEESAEEAASVVEEESEETATDDEEESEESATDDEEESEETATDDEEGPEETTTDGEEESEETTTDGEEESEGTTTDGEEEFEETTTDGEKAEQISEDTIETEDADTPEIVDYDATEILLMQLVSLGYSEDTARSFCDIFLECGISDLDGFAATSSSATVDGLISFRKVIDEDRTIWFTTDYGELIYIGLNGEDLYDIDLGGYIMSVEDVYIPESEITLQVSQILRNRTEETLDKYLDTASYYDSFAYAREDDNYMVQCEAYVGGDWLFCRVWFEYDSDTGSYAETAAEVNGIYY